MQTETFRRMKIELRDKLFSLPWNVLGLLSRNETVATVVGAF